MQNVKYAMRSLRATSCGVNLEQMELHHIKPDTAAETKPAANGVPKLLYDVRESAARLSMSVVSIRKLIRQQRLKRVADFRKILISESELKRFAATAE